MKRRELKPGDLVRVNGFDDSGDYWNNQKGVVVGYDPYYKGDAILIVKCTFDKIEVEPSFHRSQCTPIRIKKRREWWVNEKELQGGRVYPSTLHALKWDGWFEQPEGRAIRTTPPENPEGWIYLKECKWPKKGD